MVSVDAGVDMCDAREGVGLDEEDDDAAACPLLLVVGGEEVAEEEMSTLLLAMIFRISDRFAPLIFIRPIIRFMSVIGILLRSSSANSSVGADLLWGRLLLLILADDVFVEEDEESVDKEARFEASVCMSVFEENSKDKEGS